jgi:hypothetical protein
MELIKVVNAKGESHFIEDSQLVQFASLGFLKEGESPKKAKAKPAIQDDQV